MPTLAEMAWPGLHDYLDAEILPIYTKPGLRALDLGGGTGAFAQRLARAGLDVTVADIDATHYGAELPFVEVDFNDRDFAAALDGALFDVITSVEVIEHLESPISFLRNVHRLLAPGGIAILTTPNVDSAPARAKFLVKGSLRSVDEHSDPAHISPIFWDLLVRRYLPRAELELVARHEYPVGTFQTGRQLYTRIFRLVAPLMRSAALTGDSHVLVLRAT